MNVVPFFQNYNISDIKWNYILCYSSRQ